jgi:hypothetical protein
LKRKIPARRKFNGHAYPEPTVQPFVIEPQQGLERRQQPRQFDRKPEPLKQSQQQQQQRFLVG